MVRILFVTGRTGGVGVGNMQHRGTLRKSNGGSRNVLNPSLMRSVTITPPSNDLHNALLANRPNAAPDQNNITVQGFAGKVSQWVQEEQSFHGWFAGQFGGDSALWIW